MDWKCHIYLIISQTSSSFLFPLASLITKDITFRPFKTYVIAMKYKIHVFYLCHTEQHMIKN